MSSLELLSCSYDGQNLKTTVEIKFLKIKETSLWKEQDGEILSEEIVIHPPNALHSVRLRYKLKCDMYSRFCLFDPRDKFIECFQHNKMKDDFIFKHEATHIVNAKTPETRNSLVQDLLKIKNFTVVCKGSTFTTNKAILQARSPVFAAMFESNFKEATENCMEITDCEAEIVKKMIEFLETDTVKDTDGHECNLYKIAHKYQMDSFLKFCRDLLKFTLTLENTSQRLKLAMSYGDEGLQEFLISWIRPNFQYICKAKNIFTEFTADEIVNIFRDE